MIACAHKECDREASESFDVGSWWQKRPIVHYDVCPDHVWYFEHGSFDRNASEAVKRDLVPTPEGSDG